MIPRTTQTNQLASTQYDYLFKIKVEGTFAVGKTSTILRYVEDKFSNNYNQVTIGADFRIKTVNYDNKVIKLQLWDVAGSDRFRPFSGMSYRGCHGVFLMYDITDRASFEAIENYMPDIQRYAPQYCITILVGNKIDLNRARTVSFDEGAQLAEKLGLPFFEISAKTGDGVEESMNELISLMKKASEGKIEKKDQKDPTYIERLQKEYCTEKKQSTCL